MTDKNGKIYAVVFNYYGDLSELAAELGATVIDDTLCFHELEGQAVSDLMELYGLDYDYNYDDATHGA